MLVHLLLLINSLIVSGLRVEKLHVQQGRVLKSFGCSVTLFSKLKPVQCLSKILLLLSPNDNNNNLYTIVDKIRSSILSSMSELRTNI